MASGLRFARAKAIQRTKAPEGAFAKVAYRCSDAEVFDAFARCQHGAHPLGLAARTTRPELTLRATEFCHGVGFGFGRLLAARCAAQIRHRDPKLFHFF